MGSDTRSAIASPQRVSSNSLVYSGFWRRVAGVLIDSVILYGITFVLKMLIGYDEKAQFATINIKTKEILASESHFSEMFSAIWQVYAAENWNHFWIAMAASYGVMFVYFCWQQSSKYQATLGMRAMGIKIMTIDGKRISLLRSFVRQVLYLLNFLILYLGYLSMLFNVKKQALHDIITDTVVVKIKK